MEDNVNTQKHAAFFIAHNGKEVDNTRAQTAAGAITKLTLICPNKAKMSISELADAGYFVRKDKTK